MCSYQQHYYDCSRVKLVQTEELDEESAFPQVYTRLLRVPSLNSILQGNVAPRDNVEELEQIIWLAPTPEIFLHASLQFLENRLHNRIYTTKPSPSGKVVLSEGFVFSPLYPTSSSFESQSGGSTVGGHPQEQTSAKRVDSVTYSCISQPSEHGKIRSPYRNGDTYNPSVVADVRPKSLRNVGVQTSFEQLTLRSGRSSLVSDEETKPIHTFSEYVEYCQAHVRPPSQLFSFRGSSQESNNLKPANINLDSNSSNSARSTDKDMEDVQTSARMCLPYCPSYTNLTSSPTEDVDSSGQNTSERRQSLVQNSTESNTTMSSAKSILSNKTDLSANGQSSIHPTSSSGSTKSVYYYARISASFFAFLTRATQKNKSKKMTESSSIGSKTSSKTLSNTSSQDGKFDKAGNTIEDDGESKEVTSSKLNVLRRFMNFLGGAKSSKEYEKVNDHSAAVVDVRTGLFNDEHLYNCNTTHDDTKHDENRIKCSSFSTPEKHREEKLPASVVSSEITVSKKESNHFLRPIRKLQPKPKVIRHTKRVHLNDTNQNNSKTTVQELTVQQQTTDSHCPDVFKGKPSLVVKPVNAKTTHSKTVCNEILNLKFEGDKPVSVGAIGTSTDGTLGSESVIVTVTDTPSSDEKIQAQDSTLETATENTPTQSNECCICYKPPSISSANYVVPQRCKEWHRNQYNQSVMCSTNQYICYARSPENQIMNDSHHQQTIQTEEPISTESILKSNSNKGQNTCDGSSTASQTSTIINGRLILKPKPPILRNNTGYSPKLQTNETQESDLQSSHESFYGDVPKFFKPKNNPPLIRKQNTYLIEKPQVFPDRITRLLPEDKRNLGIWAFPSMDPNYYQESTMDYSTTTNQRSTHYGRSSDETNSLNYLSNLCEDSSVCTIPDTFVKNVHGIPRYYTPKVNYTMDTASSSSSDFDATTSYMNNAQSNSSRSSYWLPPKRLARDSRTFPNLNPSNTAKIKKSFSREVVKLFQRVPNPFRK